MAGGKKSTNDKTGILMIGHGEPEVFDEEVWTEGLHEMFEEFRQTGLEVPPDDAFPMMLMEIKDRYEAMGGKSRHAEVCRKQCKLLAKDFPGYDVRTALRNLIGDAAHTIHPLAGQGVNLGVLDAACLAQVVSEAVTDRRDYSSMHVLRKFERWRRGENTLMMYSMSGFKNLFSNDIFGIKYCA